MFTLPNRLLNTVITLTILVPSALLSQVKIKERVEIGPRAAINSLRSSMEISSEEKVITVPRKGHLSITFAAASNQYVPMTPNAFLEVIVGQRSDSIPVMTNFQSVTQYIPSYFEKFYFGCQAPDTPFVMYFYEDPKDTAYSVSVEVGDQVIFRYHGQQVNPVDQLSQGGNTWNVVMRIRNPLSNQCVNPGNAVKFEYLNIWVVLVDEILVGESKYYYLAGNDDDGWGLKDDWRPGMPVPARKTEVTFSVVPPIEGGRPAVYWEEKKPMTSAPKQPLPDGIIRLVGRFFDADDQQKNTVQLTASFITGYGEDYTSIDAEVKKPARLLTPGQSPTYRLSRDVFDNEMSIDSICIAYGGRYGVPPHFLKGHMRQEAGRKDFGAYTGLAPSYRYEPFSRWAQLSNAWKLDERYNGGLWIVDPKRTGYEMGTGKMIPMHQNVCDMPYPRSPKSVWDILCGPYPIW